LKNPDKLEATISFIGVETHSKKSSPLLFFRHVSAMQKQTNGDIHHGSSYPRACDQYFYNVKETRYSFNERMDGREHDVSCSAVGRMEVIPQFIEGCKETPITKMILMETAIVKKPPEEKILQQLRKEKYVSERQTRKRDVINVD
jgi:hypothetical protein